MQEKKIFKWSMFHCKISVYRSCISLLTKNNNDSTAEVQNLLLYNFWQVKSSHRGGSKETCGPKVQTIGVLSALSQTPTGCLPNFPLYIHDGCIGFEIHIGWLNFVMANVGKHYHTWILWFIQWLENKDPYNGLK